MRRVLAFLLVTALLVAFAWWLASLPGNVSATVGDIGVSLPTSWAVLALLVLLAVVYVVIRLLVMVARLPSRTRRMKGERARRQGNDAVTKTLLALAGGDAEAARRQARRSRALLGDTPQTLLLAAYAGRQAGQVGEADEAFDLLAARKDAAFLGLRGKLQGAIASGDWDAATALARQAEEVSPGAPWLRAERAKLAIRGGNWQEALALSGPGAPASALGVAAANAETDFGQALRLARQAWLIDTAFTPAALAYATRLRERGKERKVMEVLRITWGRAPHPELAEFALASTQDLAIRGTRVATLAAAAPDHGESHLLRSRMAAEAGELAEARRHAEAAQRTGLNQRRVWLLLAEIGTREGNTDAASEALHRAANADPDPHWRCAACGTVYDRWQPVCSHCGATGQITWGQAGAGVGVAGQMQIAEAGDPILP